MSPNKKNQMTLFDIKKRLILEEYVQLIGFQ